MSQTQQQQKKKGNTAQMKTYVILPQYHPTAPIFQQVSKTERVRMDKLQLAHAYLQHTFTDENGDNRTARLKLNTNTIWLEEQIEKGIAANAKFSDAERNEVKFIYGQKTTSNKTVQQYLESIPQFVGFKGESNEPQILMYDIYDKTVEIKGINENWLRMLDAMNAIKDLKELKDAQDLLIRLKGSFYEPPADLLECQNVLVKFVESNPDTAIDKVLSKKVTVDDEATILIGRAIQTGVIAFDVVPDQVAKKVGDKWEAVKEVNSEFSLEQRKQYFLEFITSDSGKLLYDDIKKGVEEAEGGNK